MQTLHQLSLTTAMLYPMTHAVNVEENGGDGTILRTVVIGTVVQVGQNVTIQETNRSVKSFVQTGTLELPQIPPIRQRAIDVA